MVLKAPTGVVPSDGSIQTLWEGTNIEGEESSTDDANKTVTTSPNYVVKTRLVDMWDRDSFTFIEQVCVTKTPSHLLNRCV